MKTTVDLPPKTLKQAKKFASRNQITLRELITLALETLIRDSQPDKTQFKLRDASVPGQGPAPEFEGAEWKTIRDAIYPNPEELA